MKTKVIGAIPLPVPVREVKNYSRHMQKMAPVFRESLAESLRKLAAIPALSQSALLSFVTPHFLDSSLLSLTHLPLAR